jgi:malate-CoA ligase subunit beta
MDIHEYQAKMLLADFGMPIARGGIAYSPEQAAYRAMELGGEKWVVKAQIHSGARGKAGGIKVCATENEVMDAANELLGRRLVTNQTGPQGKLVGRLYIEEATDIDREIYLAFVLDRSSERIMCVASSAGGMDIEERTDRTGSGHAGFSGPRNCVRAGYGFRANRRSGEGAESLLSCVS